MNKRVVGGLVCGLLLVPMAAALGQSPYRHMPVRSVGHGMDAGCSSCGPAVSCCPDPCGPRCCVPLIPAVLNGVDRLLSHIFCGRCYDPCCAPVAMGCSDCGGGYPMVSGEMEMEMASRRHSPTYAGPTRAQQTWDIPRGSAHRMTRTPGKPTPSRPVVSEHSVMRPKTAQVPQSRPAMRAKPAASKPVADSVATASRNEREGYRETNTVQQTSFQAPSRPRTPSNPLR
jgi:hypothetical protein